MIRINLLKPKPHPARSLRVKAAFVSVVLSLALQGGARIIEGTLAKPGELTEVFALITDKTGKDGAWQTGICTATLIHERVLLTAAHCVDGVESVPLKVQNGTDVYGEDRGVSIEVQSYGVYADWRQEGRAQIDRYLQEANDVGYVVLKEPVKGVRPIGLYAAENMAQLYRMVGPEVTLVGYGIRTILAPEVVKRGLTGVKAYSVSKLEGVSEGRFYRKGLMGNINSGDSGGPVIATLFSEKKLIAIHSSASLSATTDESRFGIFSPLRKSHLCWVQDETRIDLGVQGCDEEEGTWQRPFARQ